MYRSIAALILVGIFSWTTIVFAQMSSTNYIIRWDTVSTGGSDNSASATYLLRDTIGNTGVGDGSSATYNLAAGYRQGVYDQVISIDVFGQTRSSKHGASSLSGTTITTSTSGLGVGEFIALVQDEGASQVSAIGRIVSIGSGTITVDELKDDGTAPVIDGTNDFVFRMSSLTVDLDTLDVAALETSIVGMDVNADVPGGYVVQVAEDGDLRDGADTINDVADGSVTIGSEEYGARSSDTALAGSTFDSSDTAFTTTFQDVADATGTSFESRNFLTLKAAISVATVDGSYSQDLSFIVSGNY